MKRLQALFILAACLGFAGEAARADCTDDAAILTRRLAAAPDQKAANIIAARKELAKIDDRQDDEVACDNAVARAWHAYRRKPPEPAADAQQQ